MPLAARIPPGSRLEDAIRVFLAFESRFMQGLDGLGGQLATGGLRVADTEGPGDLPPELAEIAGSWQGPRGGDDRVILGGEFARRIDERDYSEIPQMRFTLNTVNVIATGRPSSVTRRYDDYNLVLSCASAATHGLTPADQAASVQRDFDATQRGSTWAAQELAARGLRQLAVFDARTTPVNIDGAIVDVPILTTMGRLLHGMAMFHDESQTWLDDNARHDLRRPYEWAVRRTVESFIETLTPTLESARRNPTRCKQDVVTLGRLHPVLFGVEPPTDPIDHLIRRHVAAFLSVPERFEAALHHALEVDPRTHRPEPFTRAEVERATDVIRLALWRPDRAVAADVDFGH